MDREGVYLAVCFATGITSLVAISDPELEAAMARAYSRWVGRLLQCGPDVIDSCLCGTAALYSA